MWIAVLLAGSARRPHAVGRFVNRVLRAASLPVSAPSADTEEVSMTEARHSRAQSPDEAVAARSLMAEQRRIAAETGWSTSGDALQAVRNHLVAVMAATR
jgi:hypothetical protein